MCFDDKLNNVFGLLSCCGGHYRELKGTGSLNHAAYLCQNLANLPLESNEVSWDCKAFSGPQQRERKRMERKPAPAADFV